MASLIEYFSKQTYKPKYYLGDRVCGTWEGIPFVGTVGNDSQIGGPDTIPMVSIILDLPIHRSGNTHNVVAVTHSQIKEYK